MILKLVPERYKKVSSHLFDRIYLVWVFMLIVIQAYVLLQAIENLVLVLKILFNDVNYPTLMVLIGVTIAGATAGIVGIFFATSIMVTSKELLNYI